MGQGVVCGGLWRTVFWGIESGGHTPVPNTMPCVPRAQHDLRRTEGLCLPLVVTRLCLMSLRHMLIQSSAGLPFPEIAKPGIELNQKRQPTCEHRTRCFKTNSIRHQNIISDLGTAKTIICPLMCFRKTSVQNQWHLCFAIMHELGSATHINCKCIKSLQQHYHNLYDNVVMCMCMMMRNNADYVWTQSCLHTHAHTHLPSRPLTHPRTALPLMRSIIPVFTMQMSGCFCQLRGKHWDCPCHPI